uniref:Uncharacterized protein n=1 Tax=Glycine max TaxID=3847 RepID=A0A0R0JZ94_SOYBN
MYVITRFLSSPPVINVRYHKIPLVAASDGEEVKYYSVFNVTVALFLLAYGFIPGPSMLVSRVLVAVLLVMLMYSYLKNWFEQGNDVERQKENETVLAAEKAEAKIVKRTPVVGDVEHTKMEALRSMDFWTLFVSFLCGVGTNLVVVNNMVQGTFNLEEKMLLDLFNDDLSRCMMAVVSEQIMVLRGKKNIF